MVMVVPITTFKTANYLGGKEKKSLTRNNFENNSYLAYSCVSILKVTAFKCIFMITLLLYT